MISIDPFWSIKNHQHPVTQWFQMTKIRQKLNNLMWSHIFKINIHCFRWLCIASYSKLFKAWVWPIIFATFLNSYFWPDFAVWPNIPSFHIWLVFGPWLIASNDQGRDKIMKYEEMKVQGRSKKWGISERSLISV